MVNPVVTDGAYIMKKIILVLALLASNVAHAFFGEGEWLVFYEWDGVSHTDRIVLNGLNSDFKQTGLYYRDMGSKGFPIICGVARGAKGLLCSSKESTASAIGYGFILDSVGDHIVDSYYSTGDNTQDIALDLLYQSNPVTGRRFFSDAISVPASFQDAYGELYIPNVRYDGANYEVVMRMQDNGTFFLYSVEAIYTPSNVFFDDFSLYIPEVIYNGKSYLLELEALENGGFDIKQVELN